MKELVFAESAWTYNKQMQDRAPGSKGGVRRIFATKTANYGGFNGTEKEITGDRVPSSWQIFERERGLHPTQKPVPLMEYLIRTYTNEGEMVLDNTMGSGTTGVACVRTNRNFIGIEMDEKYFEVANTRIEEARREQEGLFVGIAA